MIHLSGHIDVPADRMAAIATALPLHIKLSLVEDGCVAFSVTPCPVVSGRFLVDETFANRATFDAHQVRVKASGWGQISAGIPRDYKIEESA